MGWVDDKEINIDMWLEDHYSKTGSQECQYGKMNIIEPGMVVYTSNSSTQRLWQEDCKFETYLGYRVSSRPLWIT
jgi:hypothetical protein